MDSSALIEIFKSPVTGWLGGTLVGVFIGAAGAYYSQLFTDQRKLQEQRSEVQRKFDECRKQMPELIEEMVQDVKANPIKSELVLLDTRLTYGGFPSRPFFYFMNGDQPDKTYKNDQVKAMVHSHLEDKLKMLNDANFVVDIAQNRVPKYRMTDEFKKLLSGQPVAGGKMAG